MRTGRRPNLVQRSVEMADIRKLWFAGLLFVALQGSAVCCFQASRGDVSRTTRSHGRMVLPESQALDFFVAASKPLEDSTSSILLAAASNLVSPEPIHSAFSIATFLPQPFWLLMTLLPNNATTKNLMGGLGELVL